MLERAIGWMNGRGVEPVLVLNPVHPRVLAVRLASGWEGKAEAAAFLAAMGQRVRFRIVDLTDVASFGGDPDGFADGTHVSRATMRLALAAVVAREGDALR